MKCYSMHAKLAELMFIIALTAGVLGNRSPNFVIIVADDVGYGDFQSYGHPIQEYGAIDELAIEGIRFTQWYSASSMCSPSRAALLTGRLPLRSGIVGPNRVFREHDTGGLPRSEVTIAEELREAGYATGMIGKWHLGINQFQSNDGNHLPHHHGFDYVGNNLPFTYHWQCDPEKYSFKEMSRKCFLYRGKDIIEQPINSSSLSETIRNDTIEFVTSHQNDSFFLYVALPQAHSSIFCSSKFCNKSKRGLYGDNINEMAWIVSGITDTLKSLHIEDNTLVFFLSDHGPQIELCHEGGSPGFLTGGKATTWDGGIRVPAIAWWPGTVPSGRVNRDVVSTMDIFPTILDLAGVESSSLLDGVSLIDILINSSEDNLRSPIHDILFHYCSDRLMAVRIGNYKLHYFTQTLNSTIDSCVNGIPFKDSYVNFDCEYSISHDPPLIFDMNRDPGEKFSLDPNQHSDLLQRAEEMVKQHKSTIVSVPSQLGNMNSDVVPCCNPPSCHCNYVINDISKDEL